MLGRVIIIVIGGGFASYCVITAFLTFFGKNPATLHLTKFFLFGYAAINAVLTPFGISGVLGAYSRKKTLVRAFTTFQWWLATFILIGLNIFNIVLSKRGKGDFILRCQNNLAKGQPDVDFSARCTAIADDAERATFIATCAIGGIMLFLGILLLIVGTREYSNISLEEETKNLLEKANFNENVETDELSPIPSNSNDANDIRNFNNIGTLPDVRYVPPNVKRKPSNPATVNADLARRQNNANINAVQNSGLRRNQTDPTGRNQTGPNFATPLYRNPTVPRNIPPKGLTRYPTNAMDRPTNRVNVTRQPTIGNAYASRNYVGMTSPTYPVVPPQRSLSTKPKQYLVNPPPPSYAPQFTASPPPIPEINDYNNYFGDYNDYNYKPKPYTQTTVPHLTRMGMK
ncbi:hypothetical protein RclHR1_03580007 [Rhizophagus clarus]|uniref:Uncharacterized protein n=1 Tax=Rhizophagus clarus TaxID=94130 RepID=A0A2Z6RCB1_9GLOM|nr:hypothetical protein RclHR1_03580007 [Rhizophagus clarus]GES79082.1 hypothetical protein GLOIN_2v1881801 [Rhizophagus clarus]